MTDGTRSPLDDEQLTDVIPASQTDDDLMHRVQARDDVEAFGCLYDRHAARAYRVARSVCRDAHRAEEAVQDGFLSIWRGRTQFGPEKGSFRAWSMRIVRHAAIDTLRREAAAKRPRLGEQKGEPTDPQSDSLADGVAAADQAEALRASLAQLPAAQAEVIGLAFFGELSHSEIAHELALPSGTVKGRMRLGLEKLRRQMQTAA